MNAINERAAFVAGLRELADFIESHPELPVPPRYTTTPVSPHLYGTDDEDRAEVDRIAAILGATPVVTGGGHYEVARRFAGGVTYQAVAIPEQEMAAHRALTSYSGSVTPDGGAR